VWPTFLYLHRTLWVALCHCTPLFGRSVGGTVIFISPSSNESRQECNREGRTHVEQMNTDRERGQI